MIQQEHHSVIDESGIPKTTESLKIVTSATGKPAPLEDQEMTKATTTGTEEQKQSSPRMKVSYTKVKSDPLDIYSAQLRDQYLRRAFYGLEQYARMRRLEECLNLNEKQVKAYLPRYISRDADVE